MSYNLVQCQWKIKLFFKKISDENQNMIDGNSDKLLSYLSKEEENTEIEYSRTTLKIFAECLKEVVGTWSTAKVPPRTNVILFSLNLTALLSKNEERFCHLNSNDFFMELIKAIRGKQNEVAPSYKLAYIRLLSSFLEHKSGVELMIGCGFWENVYHWSISTNYNQIVTESTECMAKLLEKTKDFDENFCSNIIERLVLQLGKNMKLSTNVDIKDEVAFQHLQPILKLIAELLDYFLKGLCLHNKDVGVVLIFNEYFRLEENIFDFMVMAQPKCLVFYIGRIMFIMQIVESYVKMTTESISATDIETSIAKIRNSFIANISKINLSLEVGFVSFCSRGLLYWKLIESRLSNFVTKKPEKARIAPFSHQVAMILMIPELMISSKYCYTSNQELEQELIEDEVRDNFFYHVFNILSEDMLRIYFIWRDHLINEPNLFRIAHRFIICIKGSRKYYCRDQAVLIFRSLIFHLKDILGAVKESLEKFEIFRNQPWYMATLFELLGILIEEFQITWKDGFEATNLTAFCSEFFMLPQWSSDVVVEVLKLINISIRNCMSPNLALLVDSTDSSMALLGPLLYTKLNGRETVKRAALEVISTMARMSANNSDLPTLSIFVQWIKEVVATWSATRVSPGTNLAAFLLHLAGLLSKNEERFSGLNSNNFYIKLVNVTKARQNGAGAPVKLSYIKLLSSFIEHKSGLELMIACNFWEDVYQWSLSNENEEIGSESTLFISKLLERTVDFDEDFCDNVVKRIMLPLGENIYKSLKASSNNDGADEAASLYLQPTLKLIGNILDYFLEGICLHDKDFEVLLVFLKNCHLEERLSDFMIIAQMKCLAFYIGKIMLIMQFLELYVKAMTNGIAAAKVNICISKIRSNFIVNLTNGTYGNVMEFCNFGLLYWKLLNSKLPIIQTSKNQKSNVSFSQEQTLLLTVPCLCLDIKYCLETIHAMEEECEADEIRDTFMDKIYNIVSKDMLRIFYIWRDYLINNCQDLFKICIQGLIYVKKSRKYFCRDQAVMVFQPLIYVLKDILQKMKESPQVVEIFQKQPDFFTHIFEVLVILIEEFQITWKDSFEAIDVMALCFEFSILPYWPPDLVAQVLKLINVGIARCMSPNLALLADGAKDSTTSLLGPLLYTKLHDLPELKKAALDVICTMARMSTNKFPSLQKVLMDSELPTLVVKMSTCDGESFVRATAIKCLQEMIQVEEIWNNALQTEDLPQKMRDVLLNETEGIVRVEAATFMCVAYEHQQFQKENLDRIYETMIYSSTTDLHWEVKIRALSFWDKVIKNHLQNQGMIDDSFPNVTFSKEHRKIVTLTDSEIRKRLLKVLSQLSAIGCLGVLMSAIKDDCDMEVSKTAVKITQRLVDLFRKYNVRSDSSVPTSPSPTENGMSGTVSMSSGISVDENMDSPASNNHDLNEEILEQIVNSKDVALLKNVYVASDYGSVSNYDIQVRKIVTPNEFLQFTQQDLNNIITEKKNWLNGIEDLGSLLDDMLKTYDDDVNNMDCY